MCIRMALEVSLKELVRWGQAIIKGKEDKQCDMGQIILEMFEKWPSSNGVGEDKVELIGCAHMVKSQHPGACTTNGTKWKQQVEDPYTEKKQEGRRGSDLRGSLVRVYIVVLIKFFFFVKRES